MPDYTVPSGHWEKVEYHWHPYAWTLREHPPAAPIATYLASRKADGPAFGAGQRDQAIAWLRKAMDEQPMPPHSVPEWRREDPTGWVIECAETRLAQPADVMFGYTSVHNNYACRALLLCPRPDIPCPTGSR
ncbi:hypothetical protein [Streptomyces hoynatensis]|uniref:Uncharacterized protein n=1 Tax=Streptomyces hoynatensis TaxID=1141874 RepID=A0A3A9YWX1_9ACTN|nr:hypothetical protein [Streptomyces hoynatensis]RKN40390.1 hypothetical protein D7294_18215 [Streptomyces hoynatensis]